MITRLNKILTIKRELVSKLNSLNAEAERTKASNAPYTKDFQTHYAMLVLDLEKLNKDLMEYLNSVQRYCEEFAPDLKISADMLDQSENSNSISKIDQLKHKLNEDSAKLVSQFNTIDATSDKRTSLSLNEKSNRRISSKRILELITKLTSLFLQLREYVESTNKKRKATDSNGLMLSYYSRLINEAISEIKSSMISQASSNLFENKIQVHVNHIQSSLSNYSRLHAFKFDHSRGSVNGGLFDLKRSNCIGDR